MKERLQKIISHAGVCSRRKAEELILAGKVKVNGVVVRELGSEADVRKDRIEVSERVIRPEPLKYFLFHKPDGVITSVSDPAGRRTVMDYFPRVRERIFPVGRLDYHSEGLLIMTNDGNLDFILTHPSHEVEKEYEVVVRGKYSDSLARKMEKGVKIDSGVTAPCEIVVESYDKEKNKTYLRMILHEGKNREIRKMMEAYHYPVFGLKRIRYSFLCLDVGRGEYRRLTSAEVKSYMTFISKRVIVIGGGVAGLLASVTAASHGASVILLEKMNRVGLKMGITGKGRCNLTNAAPMMEFIKKTPGNGKFLFGAYKRFFHDELLSLLHDWGLSTKVERGGRIFPLSDDAQEVRHLFMRLLEKKGVELHLEEGATHIEIVDGQVSGVRTLKGFYPADAVILCTGGQSYPRTGSTGDGYRLAAELGHTITPIRPALVPLVCEESYCKELQGLSLKNVTLSLSAGGKRKTQEFGEMLFTHFGVSGPIVLMQSDQVSLWLSEGYEVKGEIDLKPALSEDVLDKRILRDLKTYHLKQMGNALLDLLPHSLVPVVLRLAHVSTEKPVAELTKKERISLGEVMKHLPLSIKKTRPIDEAIVTAGGVSVKEINPSTMESKLVKGLYFAGEVIDVHALTGGYNMQAAFSMGHLAAESATEGQE